MNPHPTTPTRIANVRPSQASIQRRACHDACRRLPYGRFAVMQPVGNSMVVGGGCGSPELRPDPLGRVAQRVEVTADPVAGIEARDTGHLLAADVHGIGTPG